MTLNVNSVETQANVVFFEYVTMATESSIIRVHNYWQTRH